MTARLFVDGGVQTSRDHDIVVFQGHCVGGSTVINNGIALRVKQDGLTHPHANDVFATWAALGAPVDTARFEASYRAVETRLGIEPIDQRSGRNNGTHLLNGWAAHAAASSDPMDTASPALWFSKNYGPRSLKADCAYCGYCNTGCPYGRKQGMAQSFLIDARRSGARILAETRVEKIVWGDPDGDGRRVATGVEVLLPDGSRRMIDAKKGVVVAAGTMASSRILDKSGIEGTGQGISLNIACPVVALMPRPVRAWDEDQMATYVDRGDFLLESHFQPPMSMSTLMPGWFGRHAGPHAQLQQARVRRHSLPRRPPGPADRRHASLQAARRCRAAPAPPRPRHAGEGPLRRRRHRSISSPRPRPDPAQGRGRGRLFRPPYRRSGRRYPVQLHPRAATPATPIRKKAWSTSIAASMARPMCWSPTPALSRAASG